MVSKKQQMVDDVVDPSLMTLEDVGITLTPLERVAITFLRRYRKHTDFEAPPEEEPRAT